jgi:putative nucleotidyltransferase with HDIG domain
MFKRFLNKKTKERLLAEPLPTSVASNILNAVGTKGIPPMPGAAQKAFQLAVNPNAEARDFISVIQSDEALAARIIKIANSVFFDRGKASKTIEDSVLVIGINELRCILNASSLTDIFPTKHPIRAHFWAHDVAVALIARTLAQRTIPSQSDSAFLAGLMHDVGKLLLIQRASDGYQKVLTYIDTNNVSFVEAEAQVFPFDHTEVGQLIAEKWNFTPELIDVIRNHHQSWSKLTENSEKYTLTTIVKAADIFANALGLGHGRGMSNIQRFAKKEQGDAFDFLAISSSEQKSTLDSFARNFEAEFELYSGAGK